MPRAACARDQRGWAHKADTRLGTFVEGMATVLVDIPACVNFTPMPGSARDAAGVSTLQRTRGWSADEPVFSKYTWQSALGSRQMGQLSAVGINSGVWSMCKAEWPTVWLWSISSTPQAGTEQFCARHLAALAPNRMNLRPPIENSDALSKMPIGKPETPVASRDASGAAGGSGTLGCAAWRLAGCAGWPRRSSAARFI